MWYVIWTTTGSESKLCEWISEFICDSLYDDCFFPKVEKVKKFNGEWKRIYTNLFPGYIFVSSDQKRIVDFDKQLCLYDEFAVLLSNDGIISHVDEDDTFYLESAFSNNGVLACSTGLIIEDKLHILSGPLMGREAEIVSINRHKRTAVLELSFFGRSSKVVLGLEIKAKDKN